MLETLILRMRYPPGAAGTLGRGGNLTRLFCNADALCKWAKLREEGDGSDETLCPPTDEMSGAREIPRLELGALRGLFLLD
jgi:hypothetical protein